MWHTRGIVRAGGTIALAQFTQDLALGFAQNFGAVVGTVTLVSDIDWEDKTPQ